MQEKILSDSEIVELYWQRKENAIQETEKKYQSYLSSIAYRVLQDREDGKECVNDTYFKAWNSMPPHRPQGLASYLGKIVRQVSIDRLRTKEREKRKASAYSVSLSELSECVSGNGMEEEIDLRLLSEAIETYLRQLSPKARHTFLGRYFYLDSIKEIAAYCEMSEGSVKTMLHRTRSGLRVYLEQEGFVI